MSVLESQCSLLLPRDTDPPSVQELRGRIEKGTDDERIAAMKRILTLLLQGEKVTSLLMPVIQYVMPKENKVLQKLLLLYWESIQKTGANGKLLPELILVSNHIRKNLNHANEYMRGCTLRFLCKVKQVELLEELVTEVKLNLSHRNAYVRKNAILALFSIYRAHPDLLPEAPDLVEEFLSAEKESDVSTRRNAFIMLFQCSQERAVKYLHAHSAEVEGLGEQFQLVVLEAVRKLCRSNPGDKGKYLKMVFDLLTSASNAVVYQAAVTLVAISRSPTAIRAAATTLCQLLATHSDNNVKLVVLDRIQDMKQRFGHVMEDLVMELLRGVSSPNLEIREKVISIALDLVSSRNVEEVMAFLKKEVSKTQSESMDGTIEYRRMIIRTIHRCAVRFPELAHSVVHLLMDFLGDSSPSAIDVSLFVREIMHKFPELRDSIMNKLHMVFSTITSAKVYRVMMWILSTFVHEQQDVLAALSTIKQSLGPLPFSPEVDVSRAREDDASSTHSGSTVATASTAMSGRSKTRVLADGTYVTDSTPVASSSEAAAAAAAAAAAMPKSLRTLLLEGDYYTAACAATSLTKLALKSFTLGLPEELRNGMRMEVMMIIAGMLRAGRSGFAPEKIDEDPQDHLYRCVRILSNPNDADVVGMFLDGSLSALGQVFEHQKQREERDREATATKKEDESTTGVRPDQIITFRQLKSHVDILDVEDEQEDMLKAAGNDKTDFTDRLNRIVQLTGFSDPVYAEACVTMHEYDVSLEILVVNQTNETLQNLTCELATVGDLKLMDRPQPYTIARFDKQTIRVNLKVSSSETSVIFGTIEYETGHGTERNTVILNEIHVGIDIAPRSCTDAEFRAMWAEFEWENKITVHTYYEDMKAFIRHICKCTNMRCLTDLDDFDDDCSFMSANLYARSFFGEDSLANVSVEKGGDFGRGISGFIRIRCKTQGMALALGEKVTVIQKQLPPGMAPKTSMYASAPPPPDHGSAASTSAAAAAGDD